MAQYRADFEQRSASHSKVTGSCMAQVMKAEVFDLGALQCGFPRGTHVDRLFVWRFTREYIAAQALASAGLFGFLPRDQRGLSASQERYGALVAVLRLQKLDVPG